MPSAFCLIDILHRLLTSDYFPLHWFLGIVMILFLPFSDRPHERVREKWSERYIVLLQHTILP